jgi:phytoene dehydrogenase-like protein
MARDIEKCSRGGVAFCGGEGDYRNVMQAKYDVVILGAGHNGLVAAAYLARAGLSVLLLEKNDYIGGATASQQLFPDFDARISRYAYLVSLLPEKIIRDLGLKIELRTRANASFTPYCRDGRLGGLLFSNKSVRIGRESLAALTGSEAEFEGLENFYRRSKIFAAEVWDTMLQPLPGQEELRRRFLGDDLHREAWRCLVEEPLGRAVERQLKDDLTRGLIFTDAKIGLFTHPHDESLLQNRCFLYHTIGNRTGEWKVPVGGMGRVSRELQDAAARHGAEMITNARIKKLDFGNAARTVEFEIAGKLQTVEARFVLANFGRNVLNALLGKTYEPDATHEGSVFKINMLLRRLPKPLAPGADATSAFCGTFHVDEGYEEMKTSFAQAAQNHLPEKIPCEVYCHTLTDDSILSPELQRQGFHTMTVFALDTPWRLFSPDNEAMRGVALRRCLDGLNRQLAEPIEDCLAIARNGEPCIEAKSPVDIERELGHYRGNIFHGALTFPFAESGEAIGSWGVETEFKNVYICGSSARRGGAVSGIPGHNAAMKVLETVKNGG